MKTLKFIVTGLFVAGATFMVAETLPFKGPLPFSTYDKDNNQVITKKEFEAIKLQRVTQKSESGAMMRNADNRANFVDIDTNADGIITKAELSTYQQNKFNQRNGNMKNGMKKGQKGNMNY